MARITLTMQSLGTAAEKCSGHGGAFDRGETMHAIEYDNGEKAGWFCTPCVDYWKVHGQPPQPPSCSS
jgi:hypothetical protein